MWFACGCLITEVKLNQCLTWIFQYPPSLIPKLCWEALTTCNINSLSIKDQETKLLHTFNPSAKEAETRGSLSLKPAWSRSEFQDSQGLYSETLTWKPKQRDETIFFQLASWSHLTQRVLTQINSIFRNIQSHSKPYQLKTQKHE